MKTFKIVPQITEYSTTAEFCSDFELGPKDLVFLSKSTEKYFEKKPNGAHVIYRGDYGKGEPTDLMVEAIYKDIKDLDYDRVIAVGGGTIVDVAKLLALKTFSPVVDLFDKSIPAEKTKQLVIVPTTCGTGSEVTNISILELTQRSTKMGLACDALYADYAVLIPELLNDLPYQFFATSSLDALIHAMESYLSPKATTFSEEFSFKAIDKILSGYMKMVIYGKDVRFALLNDFLVASTYAGVAFGNAGCGYVHAMSYSFGATYHVPHGEANYTLFMAIFKKYQKMNPAGKITRLNKLLSSILGCQETEVYDRMDKVLNEILPLKKMSDYGATEKDVAAFTQNTVEKQTRLTANGYLPFDAETVSEIYSLCL